MRQYSEVRKTILFMIVIGVLAFIISAVADSSEGATYDVDVNSDETSANEKPGESVRYVLRIKNTGEEDDSYDLTILKASGYSDATMWTRVESNEIFIKSSRNEMVNVYIDVPEFTPENDEAMPGIYGVKIQAQSQNDTNVQGDINLTIEVEEIYLVGLWSGIPGQQEILEGENTIEMTFTMFVRNLGNTDDDIMVFVPGNELSGEKDGWGAMIGDETTKIYSLSSLSQQSLTLTIQIDNNTYPSNYTLRVKAEPQGDTSSFIYSTIYINLIKAPFGVIDSIIPNPVIHGHAVHFSGNSSDYSEISRYVWLSDIDGELYNGTSNNFTHSGLSLGNHTISLSVRDVNGLWSNEVQAFINVFARPNATIVSISPNPALTSDIVHFQGIGTQDSGSIVRYVWRTNETELHNDTISDFSTSELLGGVHWIYFRVQDDLGTWSNDELETLIIHGQPVAKITSITPNPSLYTNSISFNGSGSDDGSIQRYVWQNGTTEFHNETYSSFLYSDFPLGSHHITLKVQDNYGVWSEDVSTTLVIHERPVATIKSISPNPAIEPATITFIGNGTDDGEIVRYVWRTEEEELYNGTDAEFSTLDLAPGVYSISLSVQDNFGVLSEEVSQELEILADRDGDGSADNEDAFPEDSSASKDSDGDGYPDEWNEGKTEKDSTRGLKLDEYPSDSKKWEKESDDGGLISGFEVVIFVLSLAIVGGFRRRK